MSALPYERPGLCGTGALAVGCIPQRALAGTQLRSRCHFPYQHRGPGGLSAARERSSGPDSSIIEPAVRTTRADHGTTRPAQNERGYGHGRSVGIIRPHDKDFAIRQAARDQRRQFSGGDQPHNVGARACSPDPVANIRRHCCLARVSRGNPRGVRRYQMCVLEGGDACIR